MNTKGFTLIEITIYIALFCILIGGAASAVYNLSEGLEKNSTEAVLSEEGLFLLHKIHWIINHAESVSSPGESSSSSTLSVIPIDLTAGSPIIIFLQSKQTQIKVGLLTEPLSNNLIEVSNLIFTRIDADGTETIGYSFTLTTRTPQGKIVSENFSGMTTLLD